MSNLILRVGDEVIWCGGFGNYAPARAKVTSIDVTEEPHEKYGESVQEVPWSVVREDRAVVNLDNGHWAYGIQLSPIG